MNANINPGTLSLQSEINKEEMPLFIEVIDVDETRVAYEDDFKRIFGGMGAACQCPRQNLRGWIES